MKGRRSPEPLVMLFFAAVGGGVQRGQVWLANGMQERGVRVACVMPRAEGPFLGELSPAVTVVDLGTRNPVRLLARLARHLRQLRPSVVVASQQHTILAALWAKWLSRTRTPLVIMQHNTLSELCRASRKPAVRWIMPTMARLFFPRADRIWAVSEGVRRDLAEVISVPKERIEIRPTTMLPRSLDAQAAQPTGHSWLDQKDCPVILGVGNLIEIKDFPTLIRAFARLRELMPARLVILGQGPERSRLEQLSRELGVEADVDLPGFSSNPYGFMARSDLFVLSSRVEGYPGVIVEALACGCPVISTDCPSGPAELLGREWLVPMGDADALRDAMARVLRSPPDPDLLRDQVRRFSADQVVSRFVDSLVPLLGVGDHPRSLSLN